MSNHRNTAPYVEKALKRGQHGANNLILCLRNDRFSREAAMYAAKEYAHRSGTAIAVLVALIEKWYARPLPTSCCDRATGAEHLEIESALSIAETEFSGEDWLIHPFVHRGLIVLGGPAKIGKTVFVHQLARSVITGMPFSGYESRPFGSVLWLNLEERKQDVQAKLRCVWNMDDANERECMNSLNIVPALPKRIRDGGETMIRETLNRAVDGGAPFAMLVVDSLTAASRRSGGRSDLYGEDYDRVEALKHICHDLNIAGIVIHHTNKRSAEDEDAINLLAGTGGLAAGSDSVMVLVRTAQGQRFLKFRSRCTDQEDLSMVMDWDNGGWRVEGRAADATTEQRAQLLSALEEFGPCSPTQLAERTRKKVDAVKQLLRRMLDKGMVTKQDEGKNTKYAAVPKFGRKPGEPFDSDSVPF